MIKSPIFQNRSPYSPYVTHTPLSPPPRVPMDERTLSFLHKRAEMKKMRDLLFYHEMKQKRISKIKSKSYRKVRVRDKTNRSPHSFFSTLSGTLIQPQKQKKHKPDPTVTLTPHPTLTPRHPPPHTPHPYRPRCTRRPPRRGRRRRRSWGG